MGAWRKSKGKCTMAQQKGELKKKLGVANG
jgi:hypothetical protein